MKERSRLLLKELWGRVYASMSQGPCLHCQVEHSRQHLDLTDFAGYSDLVPSDILQQLLAGNRRVEITAQIPVLDAGLGGARLSDKDVRGSQAMAAQARLMARLRVIAEEARDSEEAAGQNVLFVGFPFVSLPRGMVLAGQGGLRSRILAPLALVAVDLVVRGGAVQSISLSAKGERTDLVIPNLPFLAWLEQQTGLEISGLSADDDESQPWRGVDAIGRLVSTRLSLDMLHPIGPQAALTPLPRAEDLPATPAFLNAAVLGLFPISHSGLLCDLKAMAAGRDLSGPIELLLSGVTKAAGTVSPGSAGPVVALKPQLRARERFVLAADPCQTRAIRLADEHPVLVIQGPPGTGKSQTIANIIAGRLARGERVLMVCEKRTALDVVKSRLDQVGLGQLCAVVHDPQRDPDPLYMSISGRLESLPELTFRPEADRELAELDRELEKLHLELCGYSAALSQSPAPGKRSFHDLVGEWLALETTVVIEPDRLQGADLEQLSSAEAGITEILDRACKVNYPHNPWVSAAGISLEAFLSQPVAVSEEHLQALRVAAASLDVTYDPALPALAPYKPLLVQADARQELARLLRELEQTSSPQTRLDWFNRPADAIRQILSRLTALEPQLSVIQDEPLDPKLTLAVRGHRSSLPDLDRSVASLKHYGAVARKWYASFCRKRKAAARAILASYGLTLSPDNIDRLCSLLERLKARLVTEDFLVRDLGLSAPVDALLPDAELLGTLRQHGALLRIISRMRQNPALGSVRSQVAEALGESVSPLAKRLDISADRARRLHDFLAGLAKTELFASAWLKQFDRRLRDNRQAAPVLEELLDTFGTVEDILRIQRREAELPAALQPTITLLREQGLGGSDGLGPLRKALLGEEISRRIRETPVLTQMDRDHLETLSRRHRQLQEQKARLCAEVVLNLWAEVQKLRLVGHHSQFNRAGVNFKQRLVTRGKHAPKLRQTILLGSKSQESDPLFDMCPVWMASPATVAQVFPRQPIFDIILFDEASQCRLEEAIPVLARGQRVVVVGDPQQLPPTQFFEAAFPEAAVQGTESERDQLGVQQAEGQAEAQDLLSAALNAPVPRCCLDVHYRSRDEALITFSNRHFYDNRLQLVPGHPSRQADTPAIRLIRADGIYEKRGNLREAEWVVRIVRELFERPNPPSIGVACFNLVQRDLILDKLEEEAEADPTFSERYEQARQRRELGSWAGLFVRTLENLQGDERDHVIISTTFGPDPEGKFQRHFGPVSQPVVGARCFNVLVTRARQMIHLLTSIPRAEYAVWPELAVGEKPDGCRLLYGYLHWAEKVQEQFGCEPCQAVPASDQPAGRVNINPRPGGSPVALALARRLARCHGQNCEVHWGNEGFCVDVLLRNPSRPSEGMLGLLCDMSRFPQADDPVEWDLFRTAMLEAQGWRLHRICSPALFLDPHRVETELCEKAEVR